MYDTGKEIFNLEKHLPLDISTDSLEYKNKLIASEFFDKKTIQNLQFSHCCFSNISFYQTELKELTFLNCIFFNCYFRETKLSNCNFTGSKFIDCNFRNIGKHINVNNIFKFSSFRNCQIKYDFMKECLPEESSLAYAILQNLEIESYKLGLYEEYLEYKYKKISEQEKMYADAFWQKDDWNKGHFTRRESWGQGGKWCLSKLNHLVWGHGEKFSSLICSFSIIFLFSSVLLFVNTTQIAFSQALMISLKNTFSINFEAPIDAENSFYLIIILQKIIFMMFFGFFVSLLIRRVLKK